MHCGGEILRVTLYSAYDNYEDAVRLYETVLQRQAEEQKAGFCWFTLHMGKALECLLLIVQYCFYTPQIKTTYTFIPFKFCNFVNFLIIIFFKRHIKNVSYPLLSPPALFPLHPEPGLCLQLALKQLSPGVQVEPCSSAVLQFSVEEIGQLVPLLPNPCTPISATRWQTEDLDGNKVLVQVTAGYLLLSASSRLDTRDPPSPSHP